MTRSWVLSIAAACGLSALVSSPAPTPAQDKDKKKNADIEQAIERGLDYLKKTQAQDGRWDSAGNQYSTPFTALAGMALLMEGSNLHAGKYSDQVSKAVAWFLKPANQTAAGKLGIDNPAEAQRYMYGHGFATMFLASVYGEEEDGEQRKKLEAALKKAVDFIAKAQTSKKHRANGKELDIGGWGYVSAADGSNFDEGSVTITQIQALRAARNAGIPVPKETIDKAVNYLDACTTNDGGIIYNYTGGGGGQPGRPALTAAALACGLSTGEFTKAGGVMRGANPPKGNDRPSVVKWFENCKKTIVVAKGRQNHEEYQMYYYSQAMYAIGDDKWGEMFPADAKENWLTWSKFKDVVYPYLVEAQDKNNGSWNGSGSWVQAPVFATAVNLTILQLDKGILPIYQK